MTLLSLWRWSLCLVLLLGTFVTSLPVQEDPEDPSNILARQDRACRNTPFTRMCWEAGFSIATDFDAKAPPAGKTAGDGSGRPVSGPCIDRILGRYHGDQCEEFTTAQWHIDRSNGVTECPIAPGESKQYRFRCTQFGTGWYHSHFSAQYGDGVVGPIVIDGPATSNYDEDLGPMALTDWYYDTAFTLHSR
ncbi:hypothetical protein KC366_g98 [Hortaea werneckii]|nr:hypothetical protein KC366_g98 [Hortaea werneckii]